ncbi:class I SAM-dependent methyltransferase [Sphingomonas sp. NPDC019816]|uniref:class I SAM-dependent methyltransferase n=1 Tax=Sphingomonas sp. NPDC019816 TaxID=3390679 RepID=UPI003D00B385
MTSGQDWQGRVGDVWAAEWQRTERSFADLARSLDAAIASVAPDRGQALDIGSGAGSTSLALQAVRPGLRITGVDLSPELVALAGNRAGDVTGARPRFLCGDAIAVADGEGPFDLFVSRHGVMFFDDPVVAFRALRLAASDAAAMVFSCFDARERNAFATVADTAVGASPGPETGYTPGPFAFADQYRVADWLEQAGWQPDSAAQIAFDYVAGQGDDPIEDALSFLSRIGPAARAMAASPADRMRIGDALRIALAPYQIGDRIVLPASAWIWRASANRSA